MSDQLITFNCPVCGTAYSTPQNKSGQVCRCSKCSETFRVPMNMASKPPKLPLMVRLQKRCKHTRLLIVMGCLAALLVGGVCLNYINSFPEVPPPSLPTAQEVKARKGATDVFNGLSQQMVADGYVNDYKFVSSDLVRIYVTPKFRMISIKDKAIVCNVFRQWIAGESSLNDKYLRIPESSVVIYDGQTGKRLGHYFGGDSLELDY